MSNKIFFGIAAGLLAGLSIPVILKYKNERKENSLDHFTGGGVMLDEVNDYLLSARNKADSIINEAEEKSNSIIDHASRILTSAKEKTSKFHDVIMKGSSDEIMKIKESIENEILEFNKRIEKE
ncbi:MAG: hypothetical protein SGI89_00600 [bacterium]|nr:hypothetical protein [bacterium]